MKFHEVQEAMTAMGVTFERTDKNDNRVYDITYRGKTTKIYYTPSPATALAEIKKNGATEFAKLYDFANKGASKPRTVKVKVPKSAKTFDTSRPLALEKRRHATIKLQSQIQPDQVGTSPAQSTTLEQILSSSNEQEVDVNYFQQLKIDYLKKVPKEVTIGQKTYYMPDFTKNILRRLEMGRNIFLAGKSGTGKSDFVRYLAEYFGQKVLSVNFSQGTTEAHLLGKFIVKDGQTKFVYGIVPTAMKLGWWICFDEIDYAQPEHLSILQSVLEGNSLILLQNENEEIIPHENFRMFATANTKGRGDETQSYVGTNFLNLAFLDRWSIFEFPYTKKEHKIVGTLLEKDGTLAEQVLQFFTLLRKSVENGDLMNIEFTTRRLEQFCEMLAFGEPIRDVLQYELFARYDNQEVHIIQELANDVWDKVHYFENEWSIGQEHVPPPVKP